MTDNQQWSAEGKPIVPEKNKGEEKPKEVVKEDKERKVNVSGRTGMTKTNPPEGVAINTAMFKKGGLKR